MEITITNLQTKIPIRPPKIKKAVVITCRHLKVDVSGVSIVCVSPRRMQNLNRRYLNHDWSTDVLTFDYSDNNNDFLCRKKSGSRNNNPLVAEIVLCPVEARNNARLFKTTVDEEIERYVVHGILHLLGYDDHDPGRLKKMKAKEDQILSIIHSRASKR